MEALATQIAEAGYRPGLWLAPFVMHRDSAVLREHPDFALKKSDGSRLEIDTWLGPVAVLDCTNPDAEAWLRNVIRTVVRGWGYTFLKLDALIYAAQPGDDVDYHVPGTTGPGNLRAGLEIIRDEAGDRTFLLGCTCPFGPAIGLVDAMRVGPDVKAVWTDGTRPSVRHAMRMSLQRNWMHRRWWLNDPDCLVLRDTETELSEAEVRFLATAVALSGGLAVTSDNLPALSAERRQLTNTLIPPAGVAAQPLDPGEGPVPAAWRARLDETRSLVGVLNWGETSRWISVNEYLFPGEMAFNPWTGQVLGKGDLFLRPHEGTVWQVTARSPGPRVVGDTGHLNYHNLFSRQVSGRLQLRNDGAEPRVVAIDARGQIRTYELAAGEMRWFE
jgi:alpha-galactosidase